MVLRIMADSARAMEGNSHTTQGFEHTAAAVRAKMFSDCARDEHANQQPTKFDREICMVQQLQTLIGS
jgi:hypothetical protein